MKKNSSKVWIAATGLAAFLLLASGSGCAKNVDRIEFEKWGNSFVPAGQSFDSTAQGGAVQPRGMPQNGVHTLPKASIGGTTMRTFSQSTNYKMVGGFHFNGR